MNRMLIPPPSNQPVRPPMIYVEKTVQWEYKQVVRDLEKEAPLLDEAELNALGKEGWELAGIAQQAGATYFYFKRQVEG